MADHDASSLPSPGVASPLSAFVHITNFTIMAASSSISSSFVGRGSSSTSSWPKMQLPPETLVRDSMNDTENWVYGTMNYVSHSSTLISTRRNLAGSDDSLEGAEFVPTTVKIRNGRCLNLSLHQHGFELVPSPISSIDIDFYSQKNVIQQYYPHCEELLHSYLNTKSSSNKRIRGVVAFDHNVRSNQGAGKTRLKEGGGATVQSPAGLVHADYTKISAPRRLEQLGQAAQKLNDVRRFEDGESILDATVVKEALEDKRRFAFINVWRNIANNVVQQCPLACIDATTMKTCDLRTFQIHYTDRVGENYFCCPSETHEWCFYPHMKRDEVLLLKQWDSHGDVAQGSNVDTVLSTMTVHSAFLDPTSQEDAPPRESIEVRCVVVWDEE